MHLCHLRTKCRANRPMLAVDQKLSVTGCQPWSRTVPGVRFRHRYSPSRRAIHDQSPAQMVSVGAIRLLISKPASSNSVTLAHLRVTQSSRWLRTIIVGHESCALRCSAMTRRSRQLQGSHRMDGTLFSRYECKYLISAASADRVRNAMAPFVAPDHFSARAENRRYTISSLYLDDPGMSLYRATVSGLRNRFKLRIRSYQDGEAEPVFCEIKRRVGTVIRKTRTRSSRAAVRDFLDGAGEARGFELFGGSVTQLGARPIARIRYDREAYESTGGDPVRITFDTDLSYAWTSDADFSLRTGHWESAQPDGVILEVKFTERFPSWIDHMLKVLELERCSVAKYVISVDHRTRSCQRSIRKI